MISSHLSGSIGAELEATADDVETESHKAVEHACRGEHSSDGMKRRVKCPDLLKSWGRTCPSWRKSLRRCRTVAPWTATAACAARWPSPSGSWCRTSQRCRRRRGCPPRGLSPAPGETKQLVSLLTVRTYPPPTPQPPHTAHKFNFSHPLCHGELVGVGGYLVRVQFGGDHSDEVLEHLVICSQKKVKKNKNKKSLFSGEK